MHAPCRRGIVVVLVLAALAVPGLPADSAAQTDGVLIHADRSDPERIDVTVGSGTASEMQGLLMHDTLVAQSWDGKLEPLLARSWSVSNDGTVYTFRLRDDVYFHHGKKFTAADVKFSWERLKRRETASPWSSLVAAVKSIEAPNDTTAVVHLHRPDRLFLQNISQPGASIVNKDSIERYGRDYGRAVIDGTGPFRFRERRFGQQIVYDRYDRYAWGPKSWGNQGPARIKRLIWRATPDLQARQLMLEAGEVDTITHNVDPRVLDRARNAQGWTVILRDVPHTRGLFLNTKFDQLKDRAVRQAMAWAIDKKGIAETIYRPVGKPAWNLLHPTSYGAWKDLEKVAPGYDLARAARILDEAGWRLNRDGFREKGGVMLRGIQLMGLPQYAEAAAVIQESWKKIGIGVEVKMLERGALYPMRFRGDVPIEFENTGGTAQEMFEYFHSSNIPGTNQINWADRRTDEMLQTFASNPNEQTALKAFADVQKLVIVDEALFVPVYWISETAVVNTRTVHDFRPSTWVNSALGKLLTVWTTRRQ